MKISPPVISNPFLLISPSEFLSFTSGLFFDRRYYKDFFLIFLVIIYGISINIIKYFNTYISFFLFINLFVNKLKSLPVRFFRSVAAVLIVKA